MSKHQPRQPMRKAVAMRYDGQQDHAPRMVAKGKGTTAERILALAREHQIPLYEDRDLVTLLEVLDIGVEIPPKMYRALAEVLAHVYRVDAKARQR
jgi:flagellar biosynthesis protein